VSFAVAAIAACDGGATPAVPDADVDAASLTIPVIPMNIVVTDRSIQVYMEAIDFGDVGCVVTPFPEIGQCSAFVDGNPCGALDLTQSCLTDIGVEIDGVRVQPMFRGENDPWTFYDSRFGTGSLALVVAGCGHPETRISLDGPPLPTVQVSAVLENGDAHVSWTTDLPATSAIAFVATGLYTPFCHVEGVNERVFGHLTSAMSASVQAINSRTNVVTELGNATIWRAGVAHADFPTTQR
jgi:hypothetical protein